MNLYVGQRQNLKPITSVLLAILCFLLLGCSQEKNPSPQMERGIVQVKVVKNIRPGELFISEGRSLAIKPPRLVNFFLNEGSPQHKIFKNDQHIPSKVIIDHSGVDNKGGYHYPDRNAFIFNSDKETDPAKIKAKYSLVFEDTAILSRSVVQIHNKDNSVTINPPSEDSILPFRTVIRNKSSTQSATLKINKVGQPDLSSVSGLLNSILTEGMNEEAKALAIWQFLVDWRYHFFPTQEFDSEPHDPIKLINVYGYGFCDDAAAAFVVLASDAGLSSRTVGLSGHVVAETYYADAWHMFDPDQEVFYQTEDGVVASVEYLEKHPEVIINAQQAPTHFPRQKLADLIASADNNFEYGGSSRDFGSFLRSSKRHEMFWELAPSDEVVFNLWGGDKVHSVSYPKKTVPILGNGNLTRNLTVGDFEKSPKKFHYKVEIPYVILDAKLNVPAQAVDVQKVQPFAFSKRKRKWQALSKKLEGDNLVVDLRKFIKSEIIAQYDLNLLFFGLNDINDDAAITLSIDFQFAPKTIPQVSNGSNSFRILLETQDGAISGPAHGAEISFEWLSPHGGDSAELRDKRLLLNL